MVHLQHSSSYWGRSADEQHTYYKDDFILCMPSIIFLDISLYSLTNFKVLLDIKFWEVAIKQEIDGDFQMIVFLNETHSGNTR